MTEVIVTLAVILPVFLAVSYVGRYADVLHATVQSSRYAAMQRAMQPDTSRLPDSSLQGQVQARFFAHGARNEGRIRSDDGSSTQRNDFTPPLWRDLAGRPLLRGTDQVQLDISTGSVTSGRMERQLGVMTQGLGLPYRGTTVAHVEVRDLVNRIDLSVEDPLPLSLGATTVALGSGLGSSGSLMTESVTRRQVPSRLVPATVNNVIGAAFSIFERSAPVFGCVKPDVVPSHRLDRFAPSQPC